MSKINYEKFKHSNRVLNTALQTSNSKLRECLSNEFDYVWNPVQRERAIEMANVYGQEKVRLWLRHVLEGGARDMYDFVQKYRSRFNYMQLRGWNDEDRESYYNRIKSKMQEFANREEFSFIYCPFMKKRAMELAVTGEDVDKLNFVLCYLLHGEYYMSHKVNVKAKMSYLKKMGIF